MPKLNDTQTLLLSTASQRDSGSIYPLPEGTTDARSTKALTALTKAALVEERETTDMESASRTDGHLQFGLFITPAGLQAIGIEPDGTSDQNGSSAAADIVAPAPAAERTTKSAAVLALLGRKQGATLAELITATGWLPHTTRAALTGLRKKGHSIARGKRDGATCYSIVAAA